MCCIKLYLTVMARNWLVADFSQLFGRLAVLVRGKFWSVKSIETRVLITKEDGPNRDKSKQKIAISK